MTTTLVEQSFCKCGQPRVLVVDNDPTIRADFLHHLRRWGYAAFAASGEGEDLIRDAQHQARAQRCHVAIVDMRLLDDHDRRDRSGLELVPTIHPTVAIICSNYSDLDIVREALREQTVADYVGKFEGPAKVREALNRVFAVNCNRTMEVYWFPDYEPADIWRRLRLDDQAPLDEPKCLIRRLYSGQELLQLDLRPLTEQYVAPGNRVALGRSVVLVGRAQDINGLVHKEEVIKVTRSEYITAEIENYQKYVRPLLPIERTARIEDETYSVKLWNIGAIRYTSVATDGREPLRRHYIGADAGQVIAALDDLFDRTLRPWYDTRSAHAARLVYDYYTEQYAKLGERIEHHPDQSEYLNLPGIARRLLNPVLWVRKNAGRSRFFSFWEVLTHGDLHSDNIFVDHDGRTSVIDYERSGPGYHLRDFVELETDIRLRLLVLLQDELRLAAKLDSLLLKPERPGQELQWHDIVAPDARAYPALRKTFEVIGGLRRIAARVTRFEKMDEYYWALLMETLISVVRTYDDWSDSSAATLARERAQLTAALLCERLQHWGDAWPPPELTPGA